MMIDRPTWSQFSYWCGTEIWLIYCSSTNHCFTIYILLHTLSHTTEVRIMEILILAKHSVVLVTNRVLATFFPCCNLSSRAVEDEPDEDTCIWKKKQQSTDNNLRQYQCRISGCPDYAHARALSDFWHIDSTRFPSGPHRRRRFVVYILK